MTEKSFQWSSGFSNFKVLTGEDNFLPLQIKGINLAPYKLNVTESRWIRKSYKVCRIMNNGFISRHLTWPGAHGMVYC